MVSQIKPFIRSCASVEPFLPTHALLELVRNRVVVERKAINIWVFMIVDARRHADEQRLCLSNVMVGVENVSWNDHQRAMVLRAIDFINHAVSR